MRLGRVAKAFGLSLEKTAAKMGYSRQAIYQGISPTKRAKDGIDTLRCWNLHLYRTALAENQRMYDERAEAINDLEEQIFGGDKR